MADLTYNQGIHGAQDTANAMVRVGPAVPRRSPTTGGSDVVPATQSGSWARAAAAVTALAVAQGRRSSATPMNGMGDIRVDEHTLLRDARPADRLRSPRATSTARRAPSTPRRSRELIAEEDERFEIDPRLSADEREDHARMQLGLERDPASTRGYGAYSTHFDAIARGRPLRAAAAGRGVDA